MRRIRPLGLDHHVLNVHAAADSDRLAACTPTPGWSSSTRSGSSPTRRASGARRCSPASSIPYDVSPPPRASAPSSRAGCRRPSPQGSWAAYLEAWPFADVPEDDPLLELVPEMAGLGREVVSLPTFGKWGYALQAVTGPMPHLVLAGVSTDCCVVSTALAAADAGATITVVTDACAGLDPGEPPGRHGRDGALPAADHPRHHRRGPAQ